MTTKNHSFEADTGKILDIVINSLYSDREIFLRELISNASDAINKRKYLATTNQELQTKDEFCINISSDKKENKLIVSDNGIGLNEKDMFSALGTIARSGSKNFLDNYKKNLDNNKNNSENLSMIGQFGVGFYSAFMVAEKVEVLSKKAGEKNSFKWISDGSSGFQVEKDDKKLAGTDIILYLKKDAKEFLDETRISFLVKKYSDHLSFPVKWITAKVDESKQINSGSAIWTREKKDIKSEDYTNFYRQIGAVYDEPFMTLHNKTEGTMNYTSLLFIPTSRPFDLFNPDRKSRLQLYINKVFITEDCENIVPAWLRFVRGIIDTPDLDLNVSREMLQKNPAVEKIGNATVKRILNELQKKKDKEITEYTKFWEQFGIVMKEGLYEDTANRDKLLSISLFMSSKHNKLISLAEYVKEMSGKQENIYTLSSETLEQAKTSPHLEGFKARNIDVLLLTDPVDEFWMQAITEFEGKKFASATRGAIDLDNIKSKKDSNDNDSTKNDSKFKKMIEKIKSILGENVKDVRLSKTLTESPACLVSDEGGMDIQMERLMKAHNNDFVGGKRILELNPNHLLIKSLKEKIEKNLDNEFVEDSSKLLFEQAQILEGKFPENLNEFTTRINKIMERSIK